MVERREEGRGRRKGERRIGIGRKEKRRGKKKVRGKEIGEKGKSFIFFPTICDVVMTLYSPKLHRNVVAMKEVTAEDKRVLRGQDGMDPT